ncbi:hypothetical protein ABZY42_33300 [Streptomyces sp. NPDC006622]|uniref:hypothetical protein n=1 Tax=Streptomyces sp. NPDC006622 TaxID=3155459 RepID=UPI0033A7F045
MADHMFVQVPRELWELLDAADFDEVEVGSRSADQWASVAQAAVSIGNQGLAVTANLVGVYLAREQIREFSQRAAAWFGFRAPVERSAPPLIFTITGEAGAETRIEITSRPGPDGVPVLDTVALTSAIVTAMDTPSRAAE